MIIPSPGWLSIDIDHDHEYGPVLQVVGDIDTRTVPTLAHALGLATDRRPRRILVDLIGVGHLGSAGTRALLDAYAAAPDTLFAIVATGPSRNVLHTAGVDTLIAVYPYRAMALVCTAAAVSPCG